MKYSIPKYGKPNREIFQNSPKMFLTNAPGLLAIVLHPTRQLPVTTPLTDTTNWVMHDYKGGLSTLIFFFRNLCNSKKYHRLPVMATVAVRKKVVSVVHFLPSFCF